MSKEKKMSQEEIKHWIGRWKSLKPSKIRDITIKELEGLDSNETKMSNIELATIFLCGVASGFVFAAYLFTRK